jgi:proteasome lid subunit RPN8/RPN11
MSEHTKGSGSIRIRTDVLDAIGAHARHEAPNECCGLLVGAADLIDEAVPAANTLADASRYEIDPAAHIALNRRLRGTGRVVIGAYHSHPRSPAVPSLRDLAEAHYPDFVWLIVSLAGDAPDYRAYRIDRGRYDGVELCLTASV